MKKNSLYTALSTIKYFIPILTVILLMQFCDSFCTNFFDKLQSLFLTEFLIDGRGMASEQAASYLNRAALPCYAISALAPLLRALTDTWGKKLVALMNSLILISGCTLCILAPNLLLFLIGNAVITFSCSVDLQFIYIVDEIPENIRGTIYACTSGVSAFAAMLLPLFRSQLIGHYHYNWRSLYAVGIIFVLCILPILILVLKNKPRSAEPAQVTEAISFRELLPYIWKQPDLRRQLLILLILGIATAGITLYNEPLLSFSLNNETAVNQSLWIQPLALLAATILSGIISDLTNRKTAMVTDLILAGCSILLFLGSIRIHPVPYMLGAAWGCMVGSYFSSIDLMYLINMEHVSAADRGKVSAISTYAYGIGDAIGLASSGLLTLTATMGTVKLILTIPIFLIVLILLFIRKNSMNQ